MKTGRGSSLVNEVWEDEHERGSISFLQGGGEEDEWRREGSVLTYEETVIYM